MTKTLASNYGIRMVDEGGNILPYLENYGKCYMLLVDDIDKALTIPKEFMACYCEGFDNGTREMPILDKHDFELIGDNRPIVFVNVWDYGFECLCWRDITFDYTIIKKIFGV